MYFSVDLHDGSYYRGITGLPDDKILQKIIKLKCW